MASRFYLIGAMPLLLAFGCVPEGRNQEPERLRVDSNTIQIEGGERDYTHADSAEVLRLVITDWMTNPEVKDWPYGYLTDPDDETGEGPKPKLERLLIDENYVPMGFDLKIPGITVELFDLEKRDLKKGEMCIRIDSFVPKKDGLIDVEFVHTGYGFIGGAWTTYHARKVEGKWGRRVFRSH